MTDNLDDHLTQLEREAKARGWTTQAEEARSRKVQGAAVPPSALTARQRQEAVDRLGRDYSKAPHFRWPSLDAHTGALLPGDLDIVGARPSGGKTTLLLYQADYLAKCEVPWLFLGQERDPAELRALWAAQRCGFNSAHVLRHEWDQLPEGARETIERDLLAQTGPGLAELAHFGDARRLTIDSLQSWVTKFAIPAGCRVVILDHLHRLQHGVDGGQLRYEVSEAVCTIKELAVKHDLVMLVAAQLSRGGRDLLELHYPPPLSSLKESGTIEAEADLVVMLSRALKRNATAQELQEVRQGQRRVEDVEEPGVMQVRVAKNRLTGKTAAVRLRVDDCGRLTELETHLREPGDEEQDDLPF